MSTSALVWLTWAIFAVGGVLGSFALLEISAFKRGKKLQLTTLSETVWAAEKRYPWLRPIILVLCGIVALSFAFLILHFGWQIP